MIEYGWVLITLKSFKGECFMESLISADNTWVLWAILVGDAALAIWLEQRYKWASKVTGCVLALLGMMILSNIGIIPTASPVYDSVWDYVVPLAIPLLLFQCNIKKIGKESGKLLIIYLISSVGTVLGAFAGFLHSKILFRILIRLQLCSPVPMLAAR